MADGMAQYKQWREKQVSLKGEKLVRQGENIAEKWISSPKVEYNNDVHGERTFGSKSVADGLKNSNHRGSDIRLYSRVTTNSYRENYDMIDWSKK